MAEKINPVGNVVQTETLLVGQTEVISVRQTAEGVSLNGRIDSASLDDRL